MRLQLSTLCTANQAKSIHNMQDACLIKNKKQGTFSIVRNLRKYQWGITATLKHLALFLCTAENSQDAIDIGCCHLY